MYKFTAVLRVKILILSIFKYTLIAKDDFAILVKKQSLKSDIIHNSLIATESFGAGG